MIYWIIGISIIIFLIDKPNRKNRKLKRRREYLKKKNEMENYNIINSIINNNFKVKKRDINNFYESDLNQYFLMANEYKLEITQNLEQTIKHNYELYIQKN